jgi:beta-lactamase superfamily II metal-dependent hydrolase
MDFSIDMLDLGNADAFIIWIKVNSNDYVVFIDGGNPGDGEKVINHYNKYIAPHVPKDVFRMIINSHPHRDHIGGIPEIIDYFKNGIKRIYFNNPIDYIPEMTRNIINEHYLTSSSRSKMLTRIYESLDDSNELVKQLGRYNIKPYKALSTEKMDHSLFQFLGPSEDYYKDCIAFFADSNNIPKIVNYKESEEIINESEEGNKPCVIVDEKNDDSPMNLSCTIVQFLDSKSREYLFTADAGVDSFNSVKENGFSIADKHIAQLPHHGGRRNVNTNIICEINPQQYWTSAIGDKKHPRKAVIECVKKNLNNCKCYSTHKGGTKHINSTQNLFPVRNWSSAEPL